MSLTEQRVSKLEVALEGMTELARSRKRDLDDLRARLADIEEALSNEVRNNPSRSNALQDLLAESEKRTLMQSRVTDEQIDRAQRAEKVLSEWKSRAHGAEERFSQSLTEVAQLKVELSQKDGEIEVLANVQDVAHKRFTLAENLLRQALAREQDALDRARAAERKVNQLEAELTRTQHLWQEADKARSEANKAKAKATISFEDAKMLGLAIDFKTYENLSKRLMMAEDQRRAACERATASAGILDQLGVRHSDGKVLEFTMPWHSWNAVQTSNGYYTFTKDPK